MRRLHVFVVEVLAREIVGDESVLDTRRVTVLRVNVEEKSEKVSNAEEYENDARNLKRKHEEELSQDDLLLAFVFLAAEHVVSVF